MLLLHKIIIIMNAYNYYIFKEKLEATDGGTNW